MGQTTICQFVESSVEVLTTFLSVAKRRMSVRRVFGVLTDGNRDCFEGLVAWRGRQ